MTGAPHFALRGFSRRAGAVIGLASRLAESETLASTLFVELARQPLVAPVAFERLAAGVDSAAPLQRALVRIAQLGPRRPAQPPVRERRLESAAESVSGSPDGMAAGGRTAAGSAKRVTEILSAVASDTATSETPPDHVPVRRRTEIGTVPVPVVPHEEARRPTSSLAAAREVFAARVEGAGPGSDHVVRSPGAAADVVAELIAGRRMSTASLIGAALPAEAAGPPDELPASPLKQSAVRLVAALDRIEALRRALGDRRPSEARAEPAVTSAEAGRIDTHTTLDLAGARVSGLRRLAIRAGAGVRSLDDDLDAGQTPQTRREWSGAGRSTTTLPATDDDLARRIADILTREARRHGVEAGAIEP